MSSILKQIKQRRLALSLKQHDMLMRVGISRQQYQRLEAKGNPRLDTLDLVAKGLKSELVLIPDEKLDAVMAVLESSESSDKEQGEEHQSLVDDPWQGLLGEDE